MASGFYINIKESLLQGWVALGSSNMYTALLKSTYTFDDTNTGETYFSDVNSHEVSGSGYIAGGFTTGFAPTVSKSGNAAYLDDDDAIWTSATLSGIRYIIIYEGSLNFLVACVDLGSDYACTNGTFTVQWHEDGVFSLT